MIDTGINVSYAWNAIPTEAFVATVNVSGGVSYAGGNIGTVIGNVQIGDGLSSGGGGMVDGRVYIQPSHTIDLGYVTVTSLKWALWRVTA
jgi:hypothetical protein